MPIRNRAADTNPFNTLADSEQIHRTALLVTTAWMHVETKLGLTVSATTSTSAPFSATFTVHPLVEFESIVSSDRLHVGRIESQVRVGLVETHRDLAILRVEFMLAAELDHLPHRLRQLVAGIEGDCVFRFC